MTGASRKNVEPRGVKMGLIQEIKDFRPQLHIDPLAWFEELIRGKIEIVEPGPRERISSEVPIGSRRRPGKGTRVKPQVRSSQLLPRLYTRATLCNSRRGIVAEAGIQVRSVRRPPVSVSGTVISHAAGKRFPCTERGNSINRPASQNQPQRFLLEAWDGIGNRGNKIVSRI